MGAAFSSAAIRDLSPIFYDSAYKVSYGHGIHSMHESKAPTKYTAQSGLGICYRYIWGSLDRLSTLVLPLFICPAVYHIVDIPSFRMDNVAMDNIGKAGFDYDFATLEGNLCEMADAYNALDIAAHAGLTLVIAVLANIFPILQELPTKKLKLVKAVHDQMEGVARRLIEREGKNKELVDHNSKDRSIIGVLSKHP